MPCHVTRQMLLHMGASLSPFVAINAFLYLHVMLIANTINCLYAMMINRCNINAQQSGIMLMIME